VTEKPIKVDEHTDRIVTDLAHFLRSTKKSVVRNAVAEYAESRHALMAIGGGTGVRLEGTGEEGAGGVTRAPRASTGSRRCSDSHSAEEN
jgi:hypothetical protein